MDLGIFFDEMWVDYLKISPEARRIHQLLVDQGEKVINDHIALRTVNVPAVNVDSLAEIFEPFGYRPKGQYSFEEKKLKARHFESGDPHQPKIFISELILEEFSGELVDIMNESFAPVTKEDTRKDGFLYSGTHWPIFQQKYERLKSESEYAAWLYAMGFRPNHFTVSINDLSKFPDIVSFNQFLKENGVSLNQAGGEIKGSPEVFLEQSSTLAGLIDKDFADGTYAIPGCYYEFALRYPQEGGGLYQGFVAKSADKIFESTDRGY